MNHSTNLQHGLLQHHLSLPPIPPPPLHAPPPSPMPSPKHPNLLPSTVAAPYFQPALALTAIFPLPFPPPRTPLPPILVPFGTDGLGVPDKFYTLQPPLAAQLKSTRSEVLGRAIFQQSVAYLNPIESTFQNAYTYALGRERAAPPPTRPTYINTYTHKHTQAHNIYIYIYTQTNTHTHTHKHTHTQTHTHTKTHTHTHTHTPNREPVAPRNHRGTRQ
jgi:hypothetical protein